ncbi:hypothetical protein M9458_054997, partial [Cirrhinus mrigala]
MTHLDKCKYSLKEPSKDSDVASDPLKCMFDGCVGAVPPPQMLPVYTREHVREQLRKKHIPPAEMMTHQAGGDGQLHTEGWRRWSTSQDTTL